MTLSTGLPVSWNLLGGLPKAEVQIEAARITAVRVGNEELESWLLGIGSI